ncbi:MAG: hypothetical protein ACE5GW_10010, partial [Planctomycetota bacterium]
LLRFYQILYGEDRIFEGFRRVGDSFYGAGFYKHAVESYAAGEKYLQGIPPQGKRRLHPSWKEAREHFKRTIRKARMHLEALEEQ